RSLSLAASHTVGEFLLPGWLAGFRRERPDVAPQVDIANSPTVLAAVRSGAVHVGFVEGVDDVDDLDALVVAHDELVAVVAAGHRWAHRTTLAARELAEEPYVAREPGSGTRAVATAALAAAGIALEPHLQMASAQAMKRALAGGGAFALMSALAVEDEIRAGTLHAIHVRDLPLTRDLRAVRLPDPRPGTAARTLWTWLTTHAAEPLTAEAA
ncbi:MAG TPA: LysR substrate-binding domain-containing protein, partial [Solirubrobacteraceae bacterium]|nr:LysR substrate-binding domain-containing protein [Solirubrobacteraceae bacterium]